MKSSSEVLARKYRPKNFDELIGQESVSQTLTLALDSNRLSHAYLFSGLRGSGKTSTARIFAKALVCEKGVSHKPCDVCQNCIMASQNRHMDIVEMDAASNRGIDDIRELIEQVKYKPSTARFKIFIIDEVHMLTSQAFNALLKTLEEPPPFVKFILATTDPLKIPPTILSRTQHFRFKPIAQLKITNHLAHILNLEGIKFEDEALGILSRSGTGSLRDTLTLLDQAIIYSKNFVDVRTVTDMLGLVDPKILYEIFSAVFQRDEAKLLEWVKFLQDYEAQMVIDELIIYLKEKMFAGDTLYTTLVLDRFFRILSDSKYLLSINADGSFVLLLIFFKMVEALKVKEIDQMIESLQKEVYSHSNPKTEVVFTPLQEIKKEESKQEQPNLIYNESRAEVKNFTLLIQKIKDRNLEAGECFEKSITFISYENEQLTWLSCADEECKKILTHAYSVIKQLAREIFGFKTKIVHKLCEKPEEEKEERVEYPQSVSMIEDIETGMSSSCVENCAEESSTPKEINGSEILNEEVVQKAIELFEAKKVTIQSKI